MKQKVHRYVSNDFSLRASVVNATDVVREMSEIQKTKPLPTIALGQAMVGALLMAAHSKEGHQVGLLFKGSGPLGSVYSEASFVGEVRGYASQPDFIPEQYGKGLQLKPYFEEGFLTVTRHLPFQKQPHQGTVQMVHCEIGEDIAHYLKQSQQIGSIISVGVLLNKNGEVEAAGGLLIEVMPGVEEAVIDTLYKNAKEVSGSISEKIKNSEDLVELLRPYLIDIPFTRLDHEYEIKYTCRCSKERVINSLEILGIQELEDMILKNENPEVSCQMCGRKYQVSTEEVLEVRNKLQRDSLH